MHPLSMLNGILIKVGIGKKAIELQAITRNKVVRV